MKELRCKALGYECGEVLMGRTEDRLVEETALHLRSAHGVTRLPADMVAKVRNLSVNRATSDAARVVDGIFEKYNCSGEPECTWRYIAEAEMILTDDGPVHQRELKAA